MRFLCARRINLEWYKSGLDCETSLPLQETFRRDRVPRLVDAILITPELGNCVCLCGCVRLSCACLCARRINLEWCKSGLDCETSLPLQETFRRDRVPRLVDAILITPELGN